MTVRAPQVQTHLDPLELRRAFGTFPTGVTVVTTRDGDGNPRGMTANSFTSVSLDPPLLLVCIAKSAGSFAAFGACASFAVNVLHEDQQDVSTLFASRSADKFRAVGHDVGHSDAPILADCLGWFDCAVHQRVDAGDHVVLIGRIEAFGTSEAAPLAFCRGRYAQVAEPRPRGAQAARNATRGRLIEDGGRLVLSSNAR
jgi:flavin-dependent trigonelline monooxygenase, reductase component